MRASKVVGFSPRNSAGPSAPFTLHPVLLKTASRFSCWRRCISASVNNSEAAFAPGRGVDEVGEGVESVIGTTLPRYLAKLRVAETLTFQLWPHQNRHALLELSLSQILQVLSVNVFEQVPLAKLVAKTATQDEITNSHNQLVFNMF